MASEANGFIWLRIVWCFSSTVVLMLPVCSQLFPWHENGLFRLVAFGGLSPGSQMMLKFDNHIFQLAKHASNSSFTWWFDADDTYSHNHPTTALIGSPSHGRNGAGAQHQWWWHLGTHYGGRCLQVVWFSKKKRSTRSVFAKQKAIENQWTGGGLSVVGKQFLYLVIGQRCKSLEASAEDLAFVVWRREILEHQRTGKNR